jgi:Tol biopolymer transport system component
LRIEEDAVEIPLDGSAPRDLVATSRRELNPAWSPVAEQFVYVTDRRGDLEIWLASRKEGWHRPVVTQKDLPPDKQHWIVAPVWAPDGSRIAYASPPSIWISPIAGGPATPLLGEGVNVGCPTWSPDGTWIAFRENVENKLFLCKQKVGSKEPHIRVSEAAGGFRPAWSPDGTWITIQLPEGFGIVSPDGRRTKVIFRGYPGTGSACGWSRDSSILYLAYSKGQNLILSGFDVRSGAERKIVDLGTELRFSYFLIDSALLSEAPDGKSLAGSLLRTSSDIWMLEGVAPPPDFRQRLFWRPGR